MNHTAWIRSAWSLLAVAAVVSHVDAQRPADGGRSAVGVARVRSLIEVTHYKGVHKEIGLTDFTKLDALEAERGKLAKDEEGAAGIDRNAIRGLKGPERLAKMAEIRAKGEAVIYRVNEKIDPKLREVLTPEQFTRVKEIFIQLAGADALAHGEIAKDLDLSEEQRKKIAAIRAEWDKVMSEALLSGAVTDPGGTLTKMREMHEKFLKQASDVLTVPQKKRVDELKGKPFDFSQLGSGRSRAR